MPFLSGAVSFSRFQIVGGSPKRLDDGLLEKLRTHAIGQSRILRSDHVETGWIGGRHLLDREFEIEKNVILDCLHFGMRIDAAAVPPELMRAYVEMELESLLDDRPRRGGEKASEGSGDGHSNGNGHARGLGRLRREAREAAKRRAEQEIKEGRFRRQRQFPLLLDTRHDVAYLAATQPAVVERLYPLFKETFGKRLEPMTAGAIAGQIAERRGWARAFETVRPSRFVRDNEGERRDDVYWTAGSPHPQDFLGNEFLLWLWHTLAEDTDTLSLADKTDAAVVMVKQLTLECPLAESGRESISADNPTRLPEARRALASGKLPRKAGLIVSRQGNQYEFGLQAETFIVSGGRMPKSDDEPNGNGKSSNGAFLEERIEQVRHLAETVDLLFEAFLAKRLVSNWQSDSNRIAEWLAKG